MSGLSQVLRRFTGGRFPRKRPPRSDRPLFSPWKRQGAEPGAVTDPAQPHTAQTLKIDHFWAAPGFFNRIDHLHHCFGLAPAAGHVLEFGVFRGGSLNWLARWAAQRNQGHVFGFDSFEGLPEQWVRTKNGEAYDRGHFSLPGLPPVEANATLVPGFFDATLPAWLDAHPGPVALLHNDSDLYSSTIFTLTQLNERIVPGTVIVFDELCDWRDSGKYDNWAQGEWKALLEWMAMFHRKVLVLSRNQEYAAAVQVVE
jgi:hypothetical protein